MVIRDVATRWNYTHAMIKRALMLRKVNLSPLFTTYCFILISVLQSIDAWVFESERLRPLLLSNEEWRVLEQLCTILEVCVVRTQNVPSHS